jgi:hypothetical protein
MIFALKVLSPCNTLLVKYAVEYPNLPFTSTIWGRAESTDLLSTIKYLRIKKHWVKEGFFAPKIGF